VHPFLRRAGLYRLRYIAAVYLLGYALTPFNPAALGYLIFGFFSTAFTLPTRMAWKTIAGVILLYTVEMVLLGHDRPPC
jgi:hypothetical protein